jgi:hypothetical protein
MLTSYMQRGSKHADDSPIGDLHARLLYLEVGYTEKKSTV